MTEKTVIDQSFVSDRLGRYCRFPCTTMVVDHSAPSLAQWRQGTDPIFEVPDPSAMRQDGAGSAAEAQRKDLVTADIQEHRPPPHSDPYGRLMLSSGSLQPVVVPDTTALLSRTSSVDRSQPHCASLCRSTVRLQHPSFFAIRPSVSLHPCQYRSASVSSSVQTCRFLTTRLFSRVTHLRRVGLVGAAKPRMVLSLCSNRSIFPNVMP